MYASTLLLFGLLATCISARPAATSPPFEVTRLKTHIVEGGNTTIEFTVHDPDPLTNATQKCTGAWKTGSNGYPQGSYVCQLHSPPAHSSRSTDRHCRSHAATAASLGTWQASPPSTTSRSTSSTSSQTHRKSTGALAFPCIGGAYTNVRMQRWSVPIQPDHRLRQGQRLRAVRLVRSDGRTGILRAVPQQRHQGAHLGDDREAEVRA